MVTSKPPARSLLDIILSYGDSLLLIAVVLAVAAFCRYSSSRTRAIEIVLQANADTLKNASSSAQIVQRMRAIRLEGCPADFQDAYVAHIHAWEAAADLDRRVNELNEKSNSFETFVESFVRGFLGDPLGKVNEVGHALSQLSQEEKSVSLGIKNTAETLVRIAVRHGVQFPEKDE